MLEDCKTAARRILEATAAELSKAIRKDKQTKKSLGLILKEKERKRTILTEIGALNLQHDYYFDKICECHFILPARFMM